MHFQIYCDSAGEWRWRLRAANNETVADSAEGYVSKRNVLRALRKVSALLGATIETQGTVPIIEVLNG